MVDCRFKARIELGKGKYWDDKLAPFGKVWPGLAGSASQARPAALLLCPPRFESIASSIETGKIGYM